MARFRDFFRRGKQQTVAPQETRTYVPKVKAEQFENVPAQFGTTDIASLAVAGMQRTNNGTYMTTYSSTSAPQHSRVSSDASTNGESVWKAQSTGKPYDKREELTAEDEEMWANLAM